MVHPGLYHVSHLMRVIILPPDTEIFMPSNRNLPFNKPLQWTWSQMHTKADITLLAGLMHGDERTVAIITAGNHNRTTTPHAQPQCVFCPCVCECIFLTCRKGTPRLRISVIISSISRVSVCSVIGQHLVRRWEVEVSGRRLTPWMLGVICTTNTRRTKSHTAFPAFHRLYKTWI